MAFEWKGSKLHKTRRRKKWDFEYDYFPLILCINFQSGLKIPFLIIRFFFGNERRSVPRLQLHLGDIAYIFVVLYLFYYICLFQFLKHDHLFEMTYWIVCNYCTSRRRVAVNLTNSHPFVEWVWYACFITTLILFNFNFPFNLLKLSIPDEGYVRSASCVLHKISTFEYFQK